MKKTVKLFALAFVGLAIFSCTTDEYDTTLEESVKVTENIQNAQFREGDDTSTNSNESTDPVVGGSKKD